MQDLHQSALRIESSFNCYKTLFIKNFSIVFNSTTMKENEHRSIKRIFAYASFVESFFEQQDDDEQNVMILTYVT